MYSSNSSLPKITVHILSVCIISQRSYITLLLAVDHDLIHPAEYVVRGLPNIRCRVEGWLSSQGYIKNSIRSVAYRADVERHKMKHESYENL